MKHDLRSGAPRKVKQESYDANHIILGVNNNERMIIWLSRLPVKESYFNEGLLPYSK